MTPPTDGDKTPKKKQRKGGNEPGKKASGSALQTTTQPSEKQLEFVREYLVDLSPGGAAERVGYSPNYGSVLIRKPHIRAAIKAAMDNRVERVELSQDYVIRGLMEVVDRSLQRKPVMEFVPGEGMSQKTDDQGRGVWEFDGASANRALELLGRHQGMFDQTIRVTGFGDFLKRLASLNPDDAERLLEMDDDDLRDQLKEIVQ